jgi:hypothetical protein
MKKIRELKLDTISRQGFGYNHSNNAIYIKEFHEEQKTLAKYDASGEKVLENMKLEPDSKWNGLFDDSFF